MYVPATNKDLFSIISGSKFEGVKSIVICTEDSIKAQDVPNAISNISDALKKQKLNGHSKNAPLVFIRPRNIAVAELLASSVDLVDVAGFVIPKFSIGNEPIWTSFLKSMPNMMCMPTLEDSDVFDLDKMKLLSERISKNLKSQVLMIRVGGNDLFNCLGLRRSKGITIYDTPLGVVLKNLSLLFLSQGVKLSSPVMEHIDDVATLEKELDLDLAHGFVSKTAIHPLQVDFINNAFLVEQSSLDEANAIIDSDKAVFKLNNSMAEPSTHINWAKETKDRALHFGVLEVKSDNKLVSIK